MGRKQRRSRPNDDADDLHDNKDERDCQDDVIGSPGTVVDTSATSASFNDMDFTQRRELQRKQSADKRRTKMKCYLCGKAGHVRRECPGIQDDGRGMSRYKGKSNTKQEIQKFNQGKKKDDNGCRNLGPLLAYPVELMRKGTIDEDGEGDNDTANGSVAYYYDISCDVQATMDYCKTGRGKAKISQREAFQEYQQAMDDANTYTYFGGMISRDVLKQNRPWIPPDEAWTPIPNKTWYMVGLSREYCSNTDDGDGGAASMAKATTALTETLRSHPTKVVGYWTILDFTGDYCKREGCDKESQRRRVRATFQGAGETNVPVQIQILPGAAGLELDGSNAAGTDYAQVMLELYSLMTDIATQFPSICVILSNWTGLACHMMSILKTFGGGDVGSNTTGKLYIALDGAVSFAKAVHLHECAFEIPLNRLLLQTATVIPSEVANTLGRDAFFHSGLWPFVAQAVAQYKKTVSVESIVQATSSLTLELYPQLSVVEEDEGTDSKPTT